MPRQAYLSGISRLARTQRVECGTYTDTHVLHIALIQFEITDSASYRVVMRRTCIQPLCHPEHRTVLTGDADGVGIAVLEAELGLVVRDRSDLPYPLIIDIDIEMVSPVLGITVCLPCEDKGRVRTGGTQIVDIHMALRIHAHRIRPQFRNDSTFVPIAEHIAHLIGHIALVGKTVTVLRVYIFVFRLALRHSGNLDTIAVDHPFAVTVVGVAHIPVEHHFAVRLTEHTFVDRSLGQGLEGSGAA